MMRDLGCVAMPSQMRATCLSMRSTNGRTYGQTDKHLTLMEKSSNTSRARTHTQISIGLGSEDSHG